jgi:hypothetical protein
MVGLIKTKIQLIELREVFNKIKKIDKKSLEIAEILSN